jgi:hypothetical protein
MLNQMSIESLNKLVVDVRAQAKIGLMSDKEAHDQINKISVVLMRKQLEKMGIADEDEEESLWKEPAEGGQSRGDELMTNGWED